MKTEFQEDKSRPLNNEENPQKTHNDLKKVPNDAQVDQKPLTCVILFEKLINSLGMNST